MHVNFKLNIDCINRWEKASEGNISDRPVVYIWISLLALLVIRVSFVSQLLKSKRGLYESLPSRQIVPPYTWEYISRNPQERSRTMRGRVWLTESGPCAQMLFCIWIVSSVDKVCFLLQSMVRGQEAYLGKSLGPSTTFAEYNGSGKKGNVAL